MPRPLNFDPDRRRAPRADGCGCGCGCAAFEDCTALANRARLNGETREDAAARGAAERAERRRLIDHAREVAGDFFDC